MSAVLTLIAGLTGALVALVALCAWYLHTPPFRQRSGVPGPPGGVLAHGGLLRAAKSASRLHQFLDGLCHEHGPLARIDVPFSRIMVLTDADAARQLLRDRKTWLVNQALVTAIEAGLPTGLLIIDGDLWRRHKTVLKPAFYPAHIRRVCEHTNTACGALFDLWVKHGVADGSSAPAGSIVGGLELGPSFASLTLDVVGAVGFGTKFDALANANDEFAVAVQTMLHAAQLRAGLPRYLWPLLFREDQKKSFAAIKLLRGRIAGVIHARRKAEARTAIAAAAAGGAASVSDVGSRAPNDILAVLLHSQDGETLSEDEVVDEMLMAYMAGHETSSNTLLWAVHYIAANPDVAERMTEEALRVCGGGGDVVRSASPNVSYDALAQLRYVEAVVCETLRLRPVVPFVSRQAAGPTTLLGHEVSADTAVFTNFRGIHLLPEHFPQPHMFDPSRWSEEGLKAGRASKKAFFPFGDGTKSCIGRDFAMVEIKVVLTRLCLWLHAHKARIALSAAQELPVREVMTITMRPAQTLVDVVPADAGAAPSHASERK